MYLKDARFLLLPFVNKLSDEDRRIEKLLSGMKETKANPGIRALCRADPLIAEFGKSLCGRLGEAGLDSVQTIVRNIGRLLKYLNMNTEKDQPFSKYICGPYFKAIVNASKDADSPQVAINPGIYINQLVLLKISLGVMSGDVKKQEDGRNFQCLYQAHWNNQVLCVQCTATSS